MSPVGPLLVCAATSVEARACRRGAEEAGAGDEIEVLQTGMGTEAAAQALVRRLSRARRPRWLISSGFAGTRDEAVEIGAWLLATSLWRGAVEVPLSGRLRATLSKASLPARGAAFVTVDGVQGAARRWPPGVALDMESSALGRVAADAGIAFDVLRVVSDTPGQPVPSAVALWAEGMLEDRSRARGLCWLRGVLDAGRNPGAVVGFALRTRHLPRVLTQGWAQLARGLARPGDDAV